MGGGSIERGFRWGIGLKLSVIQIALFTLPLLASAHIQEVSKELQLKNESVLSEQVHLKRTLTAQYFLPTNIFEKHYAVPDILLFSGIGEDELNQLSNGSIVPSTSTEQIKNGWISTRFIILEEPGHFEKICKKTEGRVHWLHFEDISKGILRWVRSRGDMTPNFKKFLLQQESQISEAVLFDNLKIGGDDSPPPVCISGSSAVDNTRFLEHAGVKLKQMYPGRSVILMPMIKLVNLIKQSNFTDDQKAVEAVLTEELGPKSTQTRMEFLLDAFHELKSREDVDLAYQVLETVTTDFTSVRIWVITLEGNDFQGRLGVPCYKLKPLGDSDQVEFLTLFWSQDQNVDAPKLMEFARESVNSLNSEMRPMLNDIFDKSLLTHLLADVYEEEALDYGASNSTKIPNFKIKTVAGLYETWVNNKFGSYKIYSKLNEKKIVKMYSKSLETLFPGQFEKLKRSVESHKQNIQVEILEEHEQMDSEGASLIQHPSFSAYFVARFVMEQLKNGADWEDEDFAEFVLDGVLASQPMKIEANNGSGIDSFQFTHPSIAYFLNEFLKGYKAPPTYSISNVTTPLIRAPHHFPESIRELAHSSGNSDFYQIFKYFNDLDAFGKDGTSVFDKGLVTVAAAKSNLELVKIVVSQYKHNHKLEGDILYVAARRGSFSIVEYLLQQEELREVVLGSNQWSRTLLHECIQQTKLKSEMEINEKLKVIGFLTGINGKLLEKKDDQLATPILSRDVDVRLLAKLIRLGGDVLARNEKNETLLHLNSQGRTSAEYHFLVMSIPKTKLRKMVQLKDMSGMTPLWNLLKTMDPTPGTLQRFNSVGANFRGSAAEKNCTYYEPRCSPLGFAITEGRSVATLRKIIECGADFAWRGSDGRTLLHLATSLGRVDVVEFLVKGYWINAKVEDNNGLTALDMAIQSGCENCYKTGLVLRDFGVKFSKDNWPLHSAAGMGHPSSVLLLIQLGMSVDEVDQDRNTPLHMGAKCAYPNCFSTIRLLFDNNANANAVNKKRETPFEIFLLEAVNPDFETFQLLKSKTGSLEWNQVLASRAFVSLVKNGNVEGFNSLAQELRSYGADFNCKDGTNERSLLHIAARMRDEKAVKFLIENGANVNTTDKAQNTPLHEAVQSIGIIKALINSGADVYWRNDRKNTFLHEFLKKIATPTPSEFHAMALFLVERNYTNLFNMAAEGRVDTPYQLAVKRVEPYEKTLTLLHSNGVHGTSEPVQGQGASSSSGNNFSFGNFNALFVMYLVYYAF